MAEYLAAREPHDRDVLSPADAAGAVAAVLALGRERVAGRRIVKVGNPSRAVDGWESPHTVVEVVSDDAPFLVDSVSSALARRGYDVHLLFRPLLEVSGVGLTSHLHIEIDRETDLAVLEALRDAIESVVDDVFAAVADWDALRLSVTDFADALRASPPDGVGADETAEVATYLDWLADDHFTFVGAVAVDAVRRRDPGVGAGRRPPPAALRPRRCRSRAHRAPHPHPRAGAVDGAPRRAARLRHRPTPRSRRCRRRRAAPARPLHRQRLQRQRRAHPRGAPEGRRGGGEVRAPARRSRRAHPRARARHVSARRDVPPRHRRARRALAGDRGHGVAPPPAPVREPRPRRLLRVVPRLPPPRPVHDTRAPGRSSPRCATRSVATPPTSPCSSPRR